MAEIDVSTPEKAKAALGALVARDATREEELVKLRASQQVMNEQLRALAEQKAMPDRVAERAGDYIGKSGALRWHGKAEQIDGVDVFVPGLLDVDEKVCGDWQREVKASHETLSILRSRLGDAQASGTAHCQRHLRLLRAGPAPIAKLFGNVSGGGSEWMPDVTMPMLEEELRQAEGIANLFPMVSVSSKTFTLPYLNSAGIVPYLYGSNTDEDGAKRRSSSMSTTARQFTPKGMAIRVQWDTDAAEDSIIDAVPEIRRKMIEALVYGESDAIINGDTTGAQDTLATFLMDGIWPSGAVGGSDDHRRSYNGLRKRALDIGSTAKLDMSAVMTATGFNSLRRKMEPAHSRIGGGTVYIVSGSAHDQMLLFDELITLDKVGPRATILSGQVGAIFGYPVITSALMSAQLNASGVYDNSTTTKTAVLAVDTTRFRRFERRGASVEMIRDPARGSADMIVTKRAVFGCIDADSKRNVAYGYNIAAS